MQFYSYWQIHRNIYNSIVYSFTLRLQFNFHYVAAMSSTLHCGPCTSLADMSADSVLGGQRDDKRSNDDWWDQHNLRDIHDDNSAHERDRL